MISTHRLPDKRIPVLLSAHDEDLIGHDAAAILNYLDRVADREDPTAAVAATLLRTRRVRRHRAVVRAADRGELEAGLRALSRGEQHPLVARSPGTAAARTAFVFPGQGNQWPSMGAEAYERLPVYRAEVDRCAQAFIAAGFPSPLSYLLSDREQNWSQLDVQGAQFTHAAGLAELWRSCGVLPDLTVGHSLGEVAAAYLAGTVTLPDAVAVVAARATVLGQLPGRYGMAVLGVGADRAGRMIAETPGWLEVSVVNAPSSSVVSGDRDAVAGIVRLAEREGIFVRELAVDFPAHTSRLESLRATLADLLPGSAFTDAPVEFVSSAHGDVVGAGTEFTDHWYRNLRNTVRFDDAVRAAAQRGAGTFVEMSAHPSLAYALAELLEDAVVVGSGRRDEPIVEQLSANIVTAALANHRYRWSDLAGVDDRRPLLRGFPPAPMRAVHLWATPEPLPPEAGSALTVANEAWKPLAAADIGVADQRPGSVAIVATGGDGLAQQLSEAVAAHRGCRLADPAEAEVTVLVAPAIVERDVMAAADEFRRASAELDYRVIGPRCRRVWLITTCGERTGTDEPVALPGQAALAAMHRSVGFEFPDATFAHLDLPTREIDADTARGCVDVLLGDPAEVALREGGSDGTGLLVRTLRERAEPAPEAVSPAALEDVVITGGSGSIGLRYARHCVEHGARRVILLSRNGLDRADLDRLAAGHPAEVHAPACDITDADALSAVADTYGGDGASLLIHAAGAARFGRHDELGDDDVADVFSAKITGLVRMTSIWPLRHDVRILSCSSVSGVWGGYGHAAYSASNRMLDVLSAQLRAEGLDCTAVRWGLWRDSTGIAGADEIARIERSGLVAMDPGAAVIASLRDHHDEPLILGADFGRLRTFFESQGLSMPFTTADSGHGGDPAGDGDSAGPKPPAEVVRDELAATLTLDDPAAIDLGEALVDLGVDSLLAVDLRKRLRRGTGRSVPLAELLGGITGAALVEYLDSPPSGGEPAASEESTAKPENIAKPETPERLGSARD